MCYYIGVEREHICVEERKREEKDKWDRIAVPSLRMQNGQNACAETKTF